MENLLVMPHGRAQEQKITIGGTKDGTVLAYRIEITQDAGWRTRRLARSCRR